MLCKWNASTDITFEVHEVRKPTRAGSIVTFFYIEDFIKGMKGGTKRYWVTHFDDIELVAGDRVKLLDIDKIVTSKNPKDGKFMQFIEAIVEVVKEPKAEKEPKKIISPYE